MFASRAAGQSPPLSTFYALTPAQQNACAINPYLLPASTFLRFAEAFPLNFIISCFEASHPPGAYPFKDIFTQRIDTALHQRADAHGRDFADVKQAFFIVMRTNTRIAKMRHEHHERVMKVRKIMTVQQEAREARVRREMMDQLMGRKTGTGTDRRHPQEPRSSPPQVSHSLLPPGMTLPSLASMKLPAPTSRPVGTQNIREAHPTSEHEELTTGVPPTQPSTLPPLVPTIRTLGGGYLPEEKRLLHKVDLVSVTQLNTTHSAKTFVRSVAEDQAYPVEMSVSSPVEVSIHQPSPPASPAAEMSSPQPGSPSSPADVSNRRSSPRASPPAEMSRLHTSPPPPAGMSRLQTPPPPPSPPKPAPTAQPSQLPAQVRRPALKPTQMPLSPAPATVPAKVAVPAEKPSARVPEPDKVSALHPPVNYVSVSKIRKAAPEPDKVSALHPAPTAAAASELTAISARIAARTFQNENTVNYVSVSKLRRGAKGFKRR